MSPNPSLVRMATLALRLRKGTLSVSRIVWETCDRNVLTLLKGSSRSLMDRRFDESAVRKV